MAGLVGAHADEGYANTGGPKDGPVLTMMSKRLRGLRKKYNRILQIEESKAQGKAVNKEQEDVLKTKIAIAALIDEYEKLRQPLLLAVKEEVAEREKELMAATLGRREEEDSKHERRFSEEDVADLLKLLYFAHLFDIRSQGDAPSLVWTKVHERSSCLSYDFVTDDATTPLIEGDLDALALFGSMLTSRPPNVTLSHRDALQRCIEHARDWLLNSDRAIHPDAQISYSRMRERLNRILSSEYFTMTPELQTVSQQTAAAAATAAGHHEEVDIGSLDEVEVKQQVVEQQPDAVAEAAPATGEEGDNQPQPPALPHHHQHYPHQHQHPHHQPQHPQPQMVGGAPRNVGNYQQQQGHNPVGAGAPPRGRGMTGGYQGTGGRAGGRGYSNGRGSRGGRGVGMYTTGGRGGGAQFYDQAGGFHPRTNHYGGGRGGRGGGGGGGRSGMMYNGAANGAAPPNPVVATGSS
ncbi:unnamed protein product [Sphagnum jensenii]|uniref:Glycine-rich protein n=1 Tax=Sphagnum jensenii TaxID=128206 RepID=A0ABP0W0N3_9BRYO